ncbi:MAG: fibronectin type III domain-containing protein [Verrucomicrobiales bacterium]|nr:fibronectin type III domain-containing protein [Verrucomicrobiales bacterium]
MKNQQDRRMHINCGPLVEALTRRRFLALSATATLAPRLARAQDATTIRPYLQSVTPDSVWICWRTDSGTETTVRWGEDAVALNNTVSGTNQVLGTNYNWHMAQLTGLLPDSFYHYEVRTDTQVSEVFRFRTPPARGTNTRVLRFLVIGDNQILNEPRYETIIARAKAKIESRYAMPIEEAIDMFLNVGDQVDVGTLQHYQYVHLAKEAAVSPNLAVMTIVGNHETYSDPSLALYKAHFNYEHLTYGGIQSPGGDLYYANHVAKILFIHTNSEDPSAQQAAWVQQIVNAAKDDPQVEFIVSLVHRPYQAEQYVGDISPWFRNTIAPILSQTPKHVLSIGAHHHLYARGQMRDAPAYHIISGGTAWDQFWGQSTEQDFDDVQKTLANWAWQILEFDLTARKLTVECFAEAHPKRGFVYPSVLIDTFHRQFGLTAPDQPMLLNAPGQYALPFALQSSAFSTTSGELLNSTQFQVAGDAAFLNPRIDHIRDFENFYGDSGAPNYTPVDTHAGLDLLAYPLAANQLPNGEYFARVRHRDRNCAWSPWSPVLAFSIIGSTFAEPRLTLGRRIFAYLEDIEVAFEGGPGLPTDWIGIYKKGQTPGTGTGTSPSTAWFYLNNTQSAPATALRAGTLLFTTDLAQSQEWFVAFFTGNGYTEVAPRVPFYVGSTPVLSAGKTAYDEGESAVISYTNAPGGTQDWIGIYRTGQTPGQIASTQYQYASGASGSRTFAGLAKGFYFASYFANNGYFELGSRLAFSVGSTPADLSLSGAASFSHGSPFTTVFSGGAGTPKDFIGIFVRGATPGVDRLVTYLYVGGGTAGSVTFKDLLPAGDYFAALFINDSYTEISNRVDFTVTGGPAFPQIESVHRGSDNQIIIGVKVQPGSVHHLEHATNPAGPWTNVLTFTGEGLRMDVTVSYDPATESRGFWRVSRP